MNTIEPAHDEPRQKVTLIAQTKMGIRSKSKLIDTRTHQQAAEKFLKRAKKVHPGPNKVAKQMLIDHFLNKGGPII